MIPDSPRRLITESRDILETDFHRKAAEYLKNPRSTPHQECNFIRQSARQPYRSNGSPVRTIDADGAVAELLTTQVPEWVRQENSCMPDFIDILIAIDAETIIENFGKNTDPNRPTFIPDSSNLIYMTTRQDHIIGSPGGELRIKAAPDDIIRWRETTMSLNSKYTGILYKFDASSGSDLIDTPEPKVAVIKEPLPNSHDPLNPATQEINSFYWQCTVLRSGSVTYHFSFMILDRSGTKQGYYYWDPYIDIQG